MAKLMTRKAALLYDIQCHCGAIAKAGETVRLWATHGTWEGQVECIGCDTCTQPDTLLGMEAWLLKRRGVLKAQRFAAVYGYHGGEPPPGFDPAWETIEEALRQNRAQQLTTLRGLYEKLPKCEDCGEIATHHIGAEFLCAKMAQEHPQAVEVPWAKEVLQLGSKE